MIEIGQTKYSATVIRLDLLLAHDDGLPCRRIGTTAQTVWAMQASTHQLRLGGVERYRLFSSTEQVAYNHKLSDSLLTEVKA